MSTQNSHFGRPEIIVDPMEVKQLLASNTLSRTAEIVGVHRNTLYHRLQTEPVWKECIKTPRQVKEKRRLKKSGDIWTAYFSDTLEKQCRACMENKLLSEFPYRSHRGTFKNTCKACTYQRWRELYAQKRQTYIEHMKGRLAATLIRLVEFAWYTQGHIARRVPFRFFTTKRGRKPIDIDLGLVNTALNTPCRSVRQLAFRIGVSDSTLYEHLKVDVVLAEIVEQRLRRPRRKLLAPLFMLGTNVWSLPPEELMHVIEGAIPFFVLPSLRMDFCQELIASLWAGEIELQNLYREMPAHYKAFKRKYNTAFFSIDAPLNLSNGETTPTTLADLIPTEYSSGR